MVHIIGLLLGIGLWQSIAYAADGCRPTIAGTNFTRDGLGQFGILRHVDRDTGAGEPMSEWFYLPYQTLYTQCSYSKPWEIGFFVGHQGSAPVTYEGRTVFYTPAANSVGFIVDVKVNDADGPEPAWTPLNISNRIPGSTASRFRIYTSDPTAPGQTKTIKGAIRIRLIKTDNGVITQTTAFASRQDVFYSAPQSSPYAFQVNNPIKLIYAFELTRKQVGRCTVNIPTHVPLGTHNATKLATPNATTEPVPFNIELTNCTLVTAGRKVSFQVVGTPSPEATQLGVLQLNNPTDSNTAKGVGVQLIHASEGFPATPVTLNENMFFKTLGSTQLADTIKFKAHYIRNNTSEIKPGIANATATFYVAFD